MVMRWNEFVRRDEGVDWWGEIRRQSWEDVLSVGRLVGWSVGRSPFWAAAPKGSMTYAFTHMGDFLLLLLLLLRPPPSNPSLEAQIPVSRPKSQS